MPIPSSTDARAAERILAAFAGSWAKARDASPREYSDPLIDELLPAFHIDDFRGEISSA